MAPQLPRNKPHGLWFGFVFKLPALVACCVPENSPDAPSLPIRGLVGTRVWVLFLAIRCCCLSEAWSNVGQLEGGRGGAQEQSWNVLAASPAILWAADTHKHTHACAQTRRNQTSFSDPIVLLCHTWDKIIADGQNRNGWTQLPVANLMRPSEVNSLSCVSHLEEDELCLW